MNSGAVNILWPFNSSSWNIFKRKKKKQSRQPEGVLTLTFDSWTKKNEVVSKLEQSELFSFLLFQTAPSRYKIWNTASLEWRLPPRRVQLNKLFSGVSEDLGKGRRQKLVWVAKRWRVSMFACGWWMRGAERRRGAPSPVHLSQMEKDAERKTQTRRPERSALVSITVSLSICLRIWLNSTWGRLNVSSHQLHAGPRGHLVYSGINLRECRL